MMQNPQISRAALAAGIPARFLYWFGRSGRRYLFTGTSPRSLADFETGVALAVRGDAIVWVGEVQELARMAPDAAPMRASLYVHFLAATRSERLAIIEDLRPAARSGIRLAA